MDHDKAIRDAERELDEAQRAHGAAPWGAREATLTRVMEANHSLEQARTSRREAREREGVAQARAADAGTAAGALSTLVEARRSMPTPLAQAAFDETHGRQLDALETRIEAISTPAPGDPVLSPAQQAVVAADRQRYAELRRTNPLRAAALLEHAPWAATGGAS